MTALEIFIMVMIVITVIVDIIKKHDKGNTDILTKEDREYLGNYENWDASGYYRALDKEYKDNKNKGNK